MNLRLPIKGEIVDLVPFTRELWHQFWKDFKRDREESREPYRYDPVFTDRMFDIRMSQKERKHFAICRGEKVVGEIHLEGIDHNWKKACFGIEMINGHARNKGYGTEAIGLLIGFAFDKLDLNLLATTALASDEKYCHILEKKGFFCLEERDGCRYYLLGKDQ
ncbi:MAG: GNAT family N-acetyltransferase [Lachnospiraceae bacterium]|nr:GNAT family N-acetyltransferase [Lachnospiraceae bacterium]